MAYKRIPLKYIEQSNCVSYDGSRNQLKRKFIEEGYNPRKGAIVVGPTNKILNGNHRYCLLLEKYGKEHVIIVKKKKINHNQNNPITILLIFLLIPFFIFKKIFK